MAKVLKLSADLSLPLDAITQTFLVVGKRGSGKSNTAARLVEQFAAARLPFVVLDPVDTWWGLKSSRDGREKGLDVYVFGGRKQDLPLEPNGGALIAEVLCEHKISMVLSVKHLSGRARSKFMVDFAQTLFQKWGGGPLHVVLEEAHELAPQMSGGRGQRDNEENEAAMLGAFKRLWKLGRASGIGGTAVTQRPASLSKDITTQSEILIAHRTIGPQDVKAIGEWVKYHGEHDQILGELPTLATGRAVIWAPEFPSDKPLGLMQTNVLLRDTYDSASTPKVGEDRTEPKVLAGVDLDKLRTKMAATIEKAKNEDPKELRAQVGKHAAEISNLRKELEEAKFALRNPPMKKSGQNFGLTDADRVKLTTLATAIEQSASLFSEALRLSGMRFRADLEHAIANQVSAIEAQTQKAIALIGAELEKTTIRRALDKLTATQPPAAPATTSQREPSASTGRPTSPVTIGAGRAPVARPAGGAAVGDGVMRVQQKILDALAEMEALGSRTPARELVALLADYTNLQSKGFVNAVSALSSNGAIEYPSAGTMALTELGRGLANAPARPRSAAEVQARVVQLLGGKSAEILRPLIDAYPQSVARADVAAVAGYGNVQSKGFVNAVSKLLSLGFIRYPDRGTIAAAPVLFLEGR